MLGRFEKFYSDREAQTIEGEETYRARLLSLPLITKFTIKGF